MHGFLHKNCCEEKCECPRTKSVRCWVPCPTWEEKTVTCMKRVCEGRPVTREVTVCKTQIKEERVQVTVCKSVAKARTEAYTCTVVKQIAYATDPTSRA